MHYQESKAIYEEIKKAKKILTNCHQSPDWDSVASALAIKHALEGLGKDVTIVSPEPIPNPEIYLSGAGDIKTIDFATYPFANHDLFLLLDIAQRERLTGSKTTPQPPGIRTIVIDHHPDNTLDGQIKLVHPEESSTASILYKLFLDIGFAVSSQLATDLFTGIVGDTLFFKTHNTTPETFHIASDLLKLGADKDLVTKLMFNSYDQNMVNLLGVIFQNTTVDKIGRFAWSAIDYTTYQKLAKPPEARSIALDSFVNSIKDIRFSFVVLEYDMNRTAVSFRSDGDVDVSQLAQKLGGGGHKMASAARIEGKFEEVVKKVLQTAREFGQEKR
jgi:phosphoesterase RecJ-like protein